jgi:hypothetical protein
MVLTPVTETVEGVIDRALAEPADSMVTVAEVLPPTESKTVNVTVPAVTFAGNVTVMGVPFGVLPAVVLSQIPAAGIPLALKPFDGLLDVVI